MLVLTVSQDCMAPVEARCQSVTPEQIRIDTSSCCCCEGQLPGTPGTTFYLCLFRYLSPFCFFIFLEIFFLPCYFCFFFKILLLHAPECVDLASETKETPLFFAVKNGFIDCAQLLLRFGADSQALNLRFATFHTYLESALSG